MFAPFAVLILTARKKKSRFGLFFSGNCREEFVFDVGALLLYLKECLGFIFGFFSVDLSIYRGSI